MGVQVTFDYNTWRLRYPEFINIDKALVELYSVEAMLYHANDGSGPVSNTDVQQLLLGMVTAHICQLNAPKLGQPNNDTGSPQLVGGIVNATEGSVSVQTQNDYPPGTVQWWQQTKYGSGYWTATAHYRTMLYRPGCPKPVDPFLIRGGLLRLW